MLKPEDMGETRIDAEAGDDIRRALAEGIDWDAGLRPSRFYEELQESARSLQRVRSAEIEAEWEWKRRQSELLEGVIAEQRRQADDAAKDRRWMVATAFIAGATLLATIVVPLLT